jgi:hypothetical protein
MTITMNDSQLTTIQEIIDFLSTTTKIRYSRQSKVAKEEGYTWMNMLLDRFKFMKLTRKEKGVIHQYVKKMTGYSKAQVNRLILQYKNNGEIAVIPYARHTFTTLYSERDIILLARTDELHDYPNGAALKHTLHRMANIYGKSEFGHIQHVSVGHIYNIRKSAVYQRITKRYEKTHPTAVAIGIRKRPNPLGKPGYFRVDSVHQGDNENGEKGLYHINLVDEITQTEYVCCVETLSAAHLVSVLEEILQKCPFVIRGFHSDNGSEYINRLVASLLERLMIEFTKSRSRQSTDNALVEGKNNIIRKLMGYGHIEQKHAEKVNRFYFAHIHDYLNYHRSCAFPTRIKDEKKKGKYKIIYKTQNYMTPYEKLKALPNAKQYLKPGITFEVLDMIANKHTDNEMAQVVQDARYKLFKEIFHR